MKEGLVDKYEVLRYGEPIEDCFILRYDRDPHALAALAAYAASVREENAELSDDLWRIVRVHSGQPFAPEPSPASERDEYEAWEKRARERDQGPNPGGVERANEYERRISETMAARSEQSPASRSSDG